MSNDDHMELGDELRKVIQETVWEVVASHPLTGVKSENLVKVASPILENAVAGEPYRQNLLAAFGAGPYEWSLVGCEMPAGLALSNRGELGGKPEKAGKAELTFAVKDAQGGGATRKLALTIEEDVAPEIKTTALPEWSRGEFKSFALESAGGNGLAAWSIKSGALPSGLSLSEYGVLSGTTGAEGEFKFTVEATDEDLGNPETASREFALRVGPLKGDAILIRKAGKAPKIDGSAEGDEWNFDKSVEKLVVGQNKTVSASFDAMWDDKNLYVAVKVADPTVNSSKSSGGKSDSVEIFIDALNNREATYNFDDRCFFVGRGGGLDRSMSIGDVSLQILKVGEIDGGYLVEAKLEFKRLGVGEEKKGVSANYVLGLDVAVTDRNPEGGIVSQVVWKGTAENRKDPSQFGTVIMSEK